MNYRDTSSEIVADACNRRIRTGAIDFSLSGWILMDSTQLLWQFNGHSGRSEWPPAPSPPAPTIQISPKTESGETFPVPDSAQLAPSPQGFVLSAQPFAANTPEFGEHFHPPRVIVGRPPTFDTTMETLRPALRLE